MDPSVKKHLDQRLVKGEISKEEYLSLLSTLSQSANSGLSSLGSVLTSVKDALFTEYQMVTPTDESPLVVNNDFSIYGTFLQHSGTRVPFSQIYAIGYKSSQERINGTLTRYEATLRILSRAGEIIKVTANMTFHLITKIAVKQVKLLENAYIFLNSVTFEQRLARHLAEFKVAGFIVLSGDDVRLYSNGDVQKGNLRINLTESNRKGFFQIGTSNLFAQDPDSVIIGANGISFLSTRINFQLDVDKDVVRALLTGYANRPANG